MEETPATRLRNLRKAKGFKKPDDAASRFGWNIHTYKAHEDGSRGIKEKTAREYAEKFGTSAGYIMLGIGQPPAETAEKAEKSSSLYEPQWLGKHHAVRKIPVWGIVDAHDGEKYALNTEDTPIDFIEPLPQQDMDADAYGLLVAGTSMSPALEPGYIACVNTRKPVLPGRLCVVELQNGGALIKKFIKRLKGKIHLQQYNPPKDIEVNDADAVRILPVVGVVMRV